jgi:hypothetical protein
MNESKNDTRHGFKSKLRLHLDTGFGLADEPFLEKSTRIPMTCDVMKGLLKANKVIVLDNLKFALDIDSVSDENCDSTTLKASWKGSIQKEKITSQLLEELLNHGWHIVDPDKSVISGLPFTKEALEAGRVRINEMRSRQAGGRASESDDDPQLALALSEKTETESRQVSCTG